MWIPTCSEIDDNDSRLEDMYKELKALVDRITELKNDMSKTAVAAATAAMVNKYTPSTDQKEDEGATEEVKATGTDG